MRTCPSPSTQNFERVVMRRDGTILRSLTLSIFLQNRLPCVHFSWETAFKLLVGLVRAQILIRGHSAPMLVASRYCVGVHLRQSTFEQCNNKISGGKTSLSQNFSIENLCEAVQKAQSTNPNRYRKQSWSTLQEVYWSWMKKSKKKKFCQKKNRVDHL